ncbi:hypothetical protein IW138_005412 [Coemansia sp. RSA 986]|nr:hypothetical protein IW138_005412 [Coemansia sp. RSA 986]
MVLIRILGLSAALLAAAPPLATGLPTESGIVAQPRIAGGEVASGDNFNFIAYIEGYRNMLDSSLCTGSLIAPNVILTAAHCTFSPMGFGYTADQLRVSFSHTPAPESVLVAGYNVTKIVANSGFDKTTLQSDIALLILDNDIPSSVASPVKLYTGNVGTGTKLTAAGYGLTVPGDEYSAASQLMEVDLVAASQSFCVSRDPKYDSKHYLCTDDSSGRRVCPGDSGGPLSISSGDGYAVVGITDFIGISNEDGTANQTALELCVEQNSGSFFTRANAYIDWIAKNANIDSNDFTTTSASGVLSSADDDTTSSSDDDADKSAGGKDNSNIVSGDDDSALNDSTHTNAKETTSSGAAALISSRVTLLAVLGTTVTIMSAFL